MGGGGKALSAQEANQLRLTVIVDILALRALLTMLLEVSNVKLLGAQRALNVGTPQFNAILQPFFEALLEAVLDCIDVRLP